VILEALLIAAGYLAGSIPFGVIVTRWLRGVDVRSQGSGNIGATNVARVAGKKLGVLVLLLDALKGTLPVLAAMLLVPGVPWVHVAVATAAFLGHVFPVWLKFKGGKGVATALGVFVVLMPWAALAGFVVFAALFAIFRVSSIGSLAGGLTAVGVAFALHARGNLPLEYALLAVGLLLMMVFTHRGNIERILKRTEAKF
jgi:glycerol-3-phosphate acyltransferase PlsY